MKPEEVAQYLQNNPQFFDEYAEMLAEIRIPHPYDGRAISISERQIVSLREKNRQLQNRLHELISIGENNDVIGKKMHRLTLALLSFNSLEAMLQGLYDHLREDFSISHVVLRLWFPHETASKKQPRREFTPVSDAVRASVDCMSKPYCGSLLADEIKQWFGRDAKHLQSFSLIPLRKEQSVGLLVMASPSLERFYPDMGTLYLERLGELIAGTLARLTHNRLNPSMYESPRS